MARLVEKFINSIPSAWKEDSFPISAEESYVLFDANHSRFNFYTEDDIHSLESKTGVPIDRVYYPSLESDTVKYLIPISHELFHTVHDVLPVILKIYNLNPSVLFVLFKNKNFSTSPESIASAENIARYVEDFLVYKKIKYILLGINTRLSSKGEMTNYSPIVKIKNYVNIATYLSELDIRVTLQDYLVVSREIEAHLGSTSKPPERKVYLSRSHLVKLRSREISDEAQKTHSGYINDVRMENEAILENFFSSIGYEIVIPERDFSSLKDQIKFMQSVKILASVTGSGITNALFMQDGQTVIEISAELVIEQQEVSQVLPDDYRHDAFIKEHNYISISSQRDPDRVIDKLKSLISSGILPK